MTLPFNVTPASVLSDASLVAGLLTTTNKVDVVQVLNQQTNTQMFQGARPIKAEVREYAKVMDYPVESGVTLSDHRISMPTEITLTCIIPSSQYTVAYVAIRNAWLAPTVLSVQTRTGTYKNMIIAELPHSEDAEMFSAITIDIKMREFITVSGAGTTQQNNFSPANPANSTNVASGLQQGINLVSSGLSYLHAATVFGIKI